MKNHILKYTIISASPVTLDVTIRENCPNMEFLLVRILLYSDRIFYSVNLRIQSEYWKIRTKKKSVFGHFSHNIHS